MYPQDLINLYTFKFQQNCWDVINKFQTRVRVLQSLQNIPISRITSFVSHI